VSLYRKGKRNKLSLKLGLVHKLRLFLFKLHHAFFKQSLPAQILLYNRTGGRDEVNYYKGKIFGRVIIREI
jgi:hypothetical protein